MNPLRITLCVVLLAGAGYLAYVKTRSVAVPMPVALEQNQQPQKSPPHLSAASTTPLVERVSTPPPNAASPETPVDREKLDQEIIARAKAAKLSDLEKGMPDEVFGDWLLKNFSGKAKISWEANDCGENDGSGHQEELPVCAETDLNFPNGELIGISIAVASVQMKTEVHTFGPAGLFTTFFTPDNKKFCSPSLGRLAQWANGTLQEPPCTPGQ